MAERVKFYQCSMRQYANLSSTDPDGLYFVPDGKKLFLGDTDITTNIEFVEDWADVHEKVSSRFYLNTVTGEIRILDQSNELVTILPPISSASEDFEDDAKQNYLASISSIRAYVNTAVQDIIGETVHFVRSITYADGNLQVTDGQGTTPVSLDGIAHSPIYDESSLILRIPVFGHEDVVVNFPKDSAVRSGRYEQNYLLPDGTHGPALVLVVGDGEAAHEVVIPAASLVEIYTGKSTSSISVTIPEGSTEISADIRISADAGNRISVKNDGLFVDTSDLDEIMSSILSRLTDVEDDEIVVGSSNKYVSSGVTIGSSKLSDEASDKTVATEAAVLDAISWRTLH